MKINILLFVFIAFMGLAYADDIIFKGWEGLAIEAAFISVLVSVLLIMFSRLFQYPPLQQTAKAEIIYAASTIFMVLVIIGFINGSRDALVSVASNMYASSFGIPIQGTIISPSGHQATLIEIAKLYMAPSVSCSQTVINILYKISIPSEAIGSVYMEIFMSEHASGFGFKVITERINNATQFLQFFTFAYYFLVHLLDFIDHYALFFVSAGVLLRAFPPTRGAGAYLIAFSLGMYLIFPLSYIVSSSISSPYIKTDFNHFNNFQYQPGKGFISSAVCNLPDIEGVRYCGFTSMGKPYELSSWFRLHKNSIQAFFESNLTAIFTQLTVVICFLPLISMIIVFTFVLSTANLFGGNIPEIGRGLIKFL